MELKQTKFVIDTDILEELDAICQYDNVSSHYTANLLLANFIDNYAEKQKHKKGKDVPAIRNKLLTQDRVNSWVEFFAEYEP